MPFYSGGFIAKILVIDDEQGIRDLLDTLLCRKGYNVVLDLKMPGMDGLTVLQQVRNLDLKRPVIILTGAGTPEAERQVRALGVTEFVEKEFSLHCLGDSLKRLLNNSAPST